jgi:DtxR family transcriptional regulator, manganese transport regulator
MAQGRGAARAAAPLPNLAAQAVWHEKTRDAHAAELAEDYVEVIAGLIRDSGEARLVDVARCIGVSHVTANRTVARLARDGLVTSKPYRAIFLTDKGKELALKVTRRHELVVNFLLRIGVPERAARIDAEGLEHHIGEETMSAIERFLRR